MTVQFCIDIISEWKLSCPVSSPAFGAVSILDFGHSDRCVVITHFDLGSPKDVEHLFLCVFAICGSSLMMCLLGLCSINLGVQTSLQIWEVLCYYFFKNTLCPLLHLFFLWDSTNSQIVSFNHVPQIMWPFSTLFHSFFFPPVFEVSVSCFTDSFSYFIHAAVDGLLHFLFHSLDFLAPELVSLLRFLSLC